MINSNKDDKAKLDILFQEVGSYKSTVNFKELMKFIKKFHNIAPFNAMLLHMQRPGCSYVATARDWLTLHNRTIKPGATPLVILIPFGPVEFLFEVSDTEGDGAPPELIEPFKTDGNILSTFLDKLIKRMRFYGVDFHVAKFGNNLAGQIKRKKNMESFNYSTNQTIYKVDMFYDIIVNSTSNKEVVFATIVHELGHLFCGHLGIPHTKNFKLWQDRSTLTHNSSEFEAESVSWLLCERFGLKSNSAEYLSGYCANTIPEISLDSVLKAVGMIESIIYATNKIPKEFTQNKYKIPKMQDGTLF